MILHQKTGYATCVNAFLLIGPMIYNCEDIHRIRVEMAEKYSNMPKEEAERDFKQHVENTRRDIEEIRRIKSLKTG